MKVKVITESRTSYNVTAEKNVLLSPHFKLYELANNKGKTNLPQWEDSPESRKFVYCLELFRLWYKKPIVIESGYRQEAYNKKVGGDSRSAHLIGCAADWHVKHTESERGAVALMWKYILESECIIGAINYYTNGYHLEAFSDKCYGSTSFQIRDYRGTKKDW